MLHSQHIQQANEMGSKTRGHFMNPGFEADDKSTSVESMEEKQITNHAEKPAQRSNSKLLALVVIVCSLVVLLLTILMYGKIGDRCDCSSNEVASSTSSKSLATDSVEIKALRENMTRFQVALMEQIKKIKKSTSQLTKTNNDLVELGNTLGKMENLDSAFTELTSHLTETSKDLAELNIAIREFSLCHDESRCPPGFYGNYCENAAKSCQELYHAYNFTTSRLVMLHLGPTPTSVYCHVGDFGCGDGAWTTVMKIDGSKNTFHYDSGYWSNRGEYNLPGGETGFDSQETKLPTYWNTSFSKICLGMKIDQQINFITINTAENSSLYSLIVDGNYRNTSLGRDTWKTLIGSEASLQTNCNKEGFNVVSSSSHSKARIGLLGNENNNCGSCDSRIGFGTGGKPDDSNTCGNEAEWQPDNGEKHITAMGYILVQ